jgi:hypothetical protein
MRIAVAGGTGFIGRALVAALAQQGRSPNVLVRDAARARSIFPPSFELIPWSPSDPRALAAALEGAEAVVNLAGENIGAGRWTQARRRAILDSRTGATAALVEAVGRCGRPPRVFLQASAVGLYGDRADALLDEASGPGNGFLAGVVKAWEAAAAPVAAKGTRLVLLRFGMVLAADGGALPRMALPFRLCLGGWPGGGRQYVSWIHRQDACRAMLFLLDHWEASGPFNLASPHPMEARLFYGLMGRAMGRRAWLPQPAWLLRLALGGMADELLLSSQRVLPRRLTEAGFEFDFPKVGPAMRDLMGSRRVATG